MNISKTVNVIGAGFAGLECALFLAKRGVNVHIFDKDYKKYACQCEDCEFCSLKTPKQTRNLLRDELEIMGSSLIQQERKLYKDGKVEVGCIASKLLQFGRESLKNYKNIKVFNLQISEINLQDTTVVATGPYTDKGLFEWLKNNLGSMRVIEGLNQNIVVRQVDKSLLYKKQGDDSQDMYYPLSYQDYIDLCNNIIKARNDFLDLTSSKGITKESQAIEKLVEKDKDALKNFALRPCLLVGYDKRPYAVLRLKKVQEGYELVGMASNLPKFLQEQIFSKILPLKNSTIAKFGRVTDSSRINSQFVINYMCQSNKNPNVFFAGGITGLEGHLEAMASGLAVGYNVLSYMFNKKVNILPSCTCTGALIKKIILSNTLNSSLVSANYDIIKESLEHFDGNNIDCARALSEVKKFVEGSNGRSKI